MYREPEGGGKKGRGEGGREGQENGGGPRKGVLSRYV